MNDTSSGLVDQSSQFRDDEEIEKVRCSVAPLSKEQLIELVAYAAVAHPDVNEKCQLAISSSPSARRLMIRNIPFSTMDETFKALFRQFGEIDDALIVREKDNRSKGYGFVTYKNLDSVHQCLQGVHHLDGKELYVKLAADNYTDSSQRKLFIRNLPESTTEDDLREIFSQFGTLEECSVVKTKEGVSKGYGFLTFSTHKEAFKAAQQQERIIGQRVVFIHFASPHIDKKKDYGPKMMHKGFHNGNAYNQSNIQGNPNLNPSNENARSRGIYSQINSAPNRWNNQAFASPNPPNDQNKTRQFPGQEVIDHQSNVSGINMFNYPAFNPNVYHNVRNFPVSYANNMQGSPEYYPNNQNQRYPEGFKKM